MPHVVKDAIEENVRPLVALHLSLYADCETIRKRIHACQSNLNILMFIQMNKVYFKLFNL